MKKTLTILAAALVCVSAFAQKWEGLADTPQMGWNSWNKFGDKLNEELVHQTADRMQELGLADYGYVYLNLDDCWHGDRDKSGFITEDEERFPGGMRALTDYIHARGLKAGIYSDAGTQTCACRAGSLGHEYQDALVYANWGFDYLKYDWCYTEDINPKGAYRLMRDALRSTGRPILFSMCEWGQSKPWEWAAEIGHSWRTTGDICASFKDIQHYDDLGNPTWKQLGVLSIIDLNEPLRKYAGPGHWNDPDMLEVGNGMTVAEDRAHFTLWCMMAAPLILGNDLNNMSDETLAIITNRDVIAIDQDPLGIQGFRTAKNEGGLEYWFKPLEGGDWAFCIFNRSETEQKATINWKKLNPTDEISGRSTGFDSTVYDMKDLWNPKAKAATTKKNLKVEVPTHDVIVYRLTPSAK